MAQRWLLCCARLIRPWTRGRGTISNGTLASISSGTSPGPYQDASRARAYSWTHVAGIGPKANADAQFAHHSHPAQRGVDHRGQALAAVVVHHAQDPEPAAVAERVRDEVDHRWLMVVGSVIGARVPSARLRPLRRRTISRSSQYRRYSFLWLSACPSRASIQPNRRYPKRRRSAASSCSRCLSAVSSGRLHR